MPKNLVDKYAARWEELGLQLGLKHYSLDKISKNNQYNHMRSSCCYTDMLKCVMKSSLELTWGKLNNAISRLNAGTLKSVRIKGTHIH